ncbi:MAG: hypothetical protein ACRD1T_05680, partial [Acidimicrobiia bacterium]
MRRAKFYVGPLIALLIALTSAPLAANAQVAVSSADIQRLQDQVYEIGTEISQLRSRDSALASSLEADLDEVREEIIYLKVKMRKERSVSRNEYADLRDRLDSLRRRARGETTSGSGRYSPGSSSEAASSQREESRSQPRSSRPNEVPVGTELDVRLRTLLHSDTAQVEDRFEATTVTDLYSGERTLIPAGSIVRGIVSSVDRSSRTDRKAGMTLAFDQITINGRSFPIRATLTEVLESKGIKGEAGRIGTGAGVGAIIGGIIGGVKG